MQVYEKEFSISLTTRTGLVIKQSFEPRRIHSFPLLFLITAELVCERYAQLAETRVMVGYILRLEADARRDLPGLEYIVAIQIQDGLPGKAIAQGGIYIAGNRQVVNSLNRFAVHKSGDGQLQVGLGGKGEGVVHLGNAVTLLAVEGDIPKVAVFLAMPYADKSQAGIQPVLYLKGHRCLYAKLLTVVKVQVFIDFNQPLRGLVKRLYRVVLGVAEPGAEDVLAL